MYGVERERRDQGEGQSARVGWTWVGLLLGGAEGDCRGIDFHAGRLSGAGGL